MIRDPVSADAYGGAIGTSNDVGSLLWFRACSNVVLNVYASRFNGSPSVDPDDVECDRGSDPDIVYLDADPRTTGRMHPMFQVD